MKVRTDFSRWRKGKLAPFAIIAGLAIVSGGAIKVWAETRVGDFVNNIKTTLTIVDKYNGLEKTTYLSGERVTLSSRVEVTNGDINSYPGAYMLIKFPKNYASSRPGIVYSGAITGRENQDTTTHYIDRLNYNGLAAGFISSLSLQVKLDNPGTPDGYRPEIVQELYSGDGRLLSRQVKSFANRQLDFSVSTSNSKGLDGSDNTHYIAKYADDKNTVIDKNSYERFSVMEFILEAKASYSGGQYGSRKLSRISIEYQVPEGMNVAKESIDDGWSFDNNTRIAKRVYDIESSEQEKRTSIKLFYPNGTDDSIIDTFVSHKHKAIIEDIDGVRKEREHVKTIKVLARRNSSEDKFNVYKYSVGGGSVDLPNNIYSKNSSNWRLGVSVENDGNDVSIPLDKIADTLPDHLIFQSVEISRSGVDNIFSGNNKGAEIGIFLVDSTGARIKGGSLTESTKYKTIDLSSVENIKSYNKIEIDFPDGYNLPPYIDGMQSYGFSFDIKTALKNPTEYINGMRVNSAPVEWINNANFYINNEDLNVRASSFYIKSGSKVVNQIKDSDAGKFYATDGYDGVPLNLRYNIGGPEGRRAGSGPSGTIDLNSLKNPKIALLYHPSFVLNDPVWESIGRGEIKLYENYKNTGKNAIITNRPDFFDNGGIIEHQAFWVTDTTANGEHEFELVTFWDDDDPAHFGTEGLDDLDFNDDGIASKNIARSTVRVNIINPEQLGIKKYVRSKITDYWSNLDGLFPGQEIDYKIAVINNVNRTLNYSRVLEVLPRVGDKKIVRDNAGIQGDRGSTINVSMLGPMSPRDGFTIKYSTDEPGATQDESWGRNFVSENEIVDWSLVRMIKIEQNNDYKVEPNSVVDFIINAKIDDAAEEGSVAYNTAAVSLSENSDFVETELVGVTVVTPLKIQGVAFIDSNKDSLFKEGIDIALPDYKVEILRNGNVVAGLKTDDKGRYSYSTTDLEAEFAVRFIRPDNVDAQAILVPVRNGSNNHLDGSTPVTETDGIAVTPNVYLGRNSGKTHNRNIGLQIFAGSVKIEHKYLIRTPDGILFPMLKSSEVAVENANVNSGYDVRDKRKTEITDDSGLVYRFQSTTGDPEVGRIKEGESVVTFLYEPKLGSPVKARFVNKQDEELEPEVVVKENQTQVGTPYNSTKENELTKNNLVYTFESLKQGSAPENGKVKAEAQTVTYVYVPKLGGKVDAKFLDENGREIKPLENVSPDKTQVGTSYSSTPSTEVTFENIVYVYKGLGQNSAPQNGRVSEDAQTISYIYTPKRGGSVIVNFVNEDGESIKDTQILKADGTPVGTTYEAQEDTEIEKDNLVYIFKELRDGSKPKVGRVSEDSTEVTFVYAPKPGGKVVAKFTTADGTELQDEEEVSPQDTQVGTEYASTKPEEIKKDGLVYIFKELKEDSAPEEGRVTVDAQTVNYIYEPKLGDAVSMRFIDTNGVLLGKIEEILPKGKQVGTPYEAKIPETITIDGKTYRLKIVRSDDGDAGEKGEISENPQMITVIFEFVPPVETPNTGFNKSEDSFNPIIVIAGFAILAGTSVAVVAKQKSSKK